MRERHIGNIRNDEEFRSIGNYVDWGDMRRENDTRKHSNETRK